MLFRFKIRKYLSSYTVGNRQHMELKMFLNTKLIDKKHMNINMKTSLILLAATLASTAPQFTQAQKFYKWVDGSGSTHYTTTPPPRNAKKLGNVSTYNDTPSSRNLTPPSPASNSQENSQAANNANQAAKEAADAAANQTLPKVPPSSNSAPSQSNERITLPQVGEDPTRGQEQILNTGRNLL